MARWLGSMVPELLSIGRGFESQPPRCRAQPWTSCSHACASVIKQYNLVPANGRWCLAAGKVTAGLVSHWPCVTDISGSPPTGSRPRTGRWAPPTLCCGAWLTLPFTFIAHIICTRVYVWLQLAVGSSTDMDTSQVNPSDILISEVLSYLITYDVFFSAVVSRYSFSAGSTGVRGLTRGLATLLPKFLQSSSRSLQWSETGMEDPQEDPLAVYCFFICSGSVLLGDIGVSWST